jgi:hypothetical protein
MSCILAAGSAGAGTENSVVTVAGSAAACGTDRSASWLVGASKLRRFRDGCTAFVAPLLLLLPLPDLVPEVLGFVGVWQLTLETFTSLGFMPSALL